MTTKVKISVAAPSHRDVRVDMMGAIEAGGVRKVAHVTLGEGEEREFYVYAGQDLRITEVSKGLAKREADIAAHKASLRTLGTSSS